MSIGKIVFFSGSPFNSEEKNKEQKLEKIKKIY